MDAFGLKSANQAHRDVARVVVSRDEIASRLDGLAREIAECYGDRQITLLAVLTGSLVFLADLIRRLPMPLRVDVTSISSYPRDATESQGPRLYGQLNLDIAGRDVLIVDDILDSGQTLRKLVRMIRRGKPASVRSCVLLKKDRPDLSDRFQPDFVGFELPDLFVVGYGLDFDNLYRNLPDICVLSAHACEDAR